MSDAISSHPQKRSSMSEEREAGTTEVDPALVREGEATGLPRGKLYPLNSRRLVAAYLRQIAETLGLPTAGSADEVRQLIEGKLQETRDVNNIQVVVAEATVREVKLSLMDDDGVFVETPAVSRLAKETTVSEELCQELDEAHMRNEDLQTELTVTVQELDRQRAEVTRLTEELSRGS